MFWYRKCFGSSQPCFPFTFEFYIKAQTLKNNILQNIINPPYYTVLLASKTINHYVYCSWWNCNPSSISFCREKSPKNPMLRQWFRTKKFELIRDTALFQRCTVAGEMKVDGRVDTRAWTGERLGKCKRRQMMVQKLLDIFAPPQPPNEPKWNTCQGFN